MVREDGSRDQVSRDVIRKVDKGTVHKSANMVGIVNGQALNVLSSRRIRTGRPQRSKSAGMIVYCQKERT